MGEEGQETQGARGDGQELAQSTKDATEKGGNHSFGGGNQI